MDWSLHAPRQFRLTVTAKFCISIHAKSVPTKWRPERERGGGDGGWGEGERMRERETYRNYERLWQR